MPPLAFAYNTGNNGQPDNANNFHRGADSTNLSSSSDPSPSPVSADPSTSGGGSQVALSATPESSSTPAPTFQPISSDQQNNNDSSSSDISGGNWIVVFEPSSTPAPTNSPTPIPSLTPSPKSVPVLNTENNSNPPEKPSAGTSAGVFQDLGSKIIDPPAYLDEYLFVKDLYLSDSLSKDDTIILMVLSTLFVGGGLVLVNLENIKILADRLRKSESDYSLRYG